MTKRCANWYLLQGIAPWPRLRHGVDGWRTMHAFPPPRRETKQEQNKKHQNCRTPHTTDTLHNTCMMCKRACTHERTHSRMHAACHCTQACACDTHVSSPCVRAWTVCACMLSAAVRDNVHARARQCMHEISRSGNICNHARMSDWLKTCHP